MITWDSGRAWGHCAGRGESVYSFYVTRGAQVDQVGKSLPSVSSKIALEELRSGKMFEKGI